MSSTRKRFALGFGLVMLVVAMNLLAACGQTTRSSPAAHAVQPTAVTVAMHDPGCHWFLVGSKYTKTLSVKGPVSVKNLDEATLSVGGKLDPVGQSVTVPRGTYEITMVGQAPGDNHLKLNVQ